MPKPVSTSPISSFLYDLSNLSSPFSTDTNKITDMDHSVLLYMVKKSRVLLLNELQSLKFLTISLVSLIIWYILTNFLPISLPLILSSYNLVLFLFFYLPLLFLAILFNNNIKLNNIDIMKNTPKKSTLIIKPKDLKRFTTYFVSRIFYINFTIYLIMFLILYQICFSSSSSILNTSTISSFSNDNSLNSPDISFSTSSYNSSSLLSYSSSYSSPSTSVFYYNIFHYEENYNQDMKQFIFLQDLLSNLFLLHFILLSFSMLIRGQNLFEQYPKYNSNKLYYNIIFFIILIQLLHNLVRYYIRNCLISSSIISLSCDNTEDNIYDYENISIITLVLIFVFIIVFTLLLHHYINQKDYKYYQRYLQFLRLEFDTRLGMHSPR